MTSKMIRIENLGKRYKIGRNLKKENLTETLRADIQEAIGAAANTFSKISGKENGAQTKEENHIWALRHINLEIEPGESVGVIGGNGAGKSTLLKILSRITVPTEGRVRLKGRVGALLEVGSGFHPELTGRENIYLNGAILGMQRAEINRKMDEIINFSGVEKFLNTPVKFYSSGMRVRLAFSVAAHLEPEILLVDEVLAVGDFAFQQKSLNKMENVVRSGRTVIFVSHNLAAVKALCQKAAFIENGELKYYGGVDQAISTYLNQGALQRVEKVERSLDPSLPLQILQAGTLNQKLVDTAKFGHDEEIAFQFQVAVNIPAYRMFLGFDILDENLETILTSHDFEMEESRMTSREPGLYTYRIKLPAHQLVPGSYRINAYAKKRFYSRYVLVDQVDHVCPFEVYDNGSVLARVSVDWRGRVHIPLAWEQVEKQALTGDH